jgi:23S rRNA (cytidine1920-2'-O)/16S rRNA (cytidine1409-2'-O)-methyltransferase
MTRVRLDTLLVERGLAQSRERARAMILAGHVRVAGVQKPKAGSLVGDDSEIEVATPDHPYVGRGGVKLAHALDAFALGVDGLAALDIGASTGGFTDVLLRRGARLVVALDVGHGQIDWRLRRDPRVTVLEHVNARTLTRAELPAEPGKYDIVTVDVSFISVRAILPVLPPLLADDGHLIVLVKPQFEAGRGEVGKGGVVKDPAVHERVVAEVRDEGAGLGLASAGTTPSPITGSEGNREFFLLFTHARASDGH